MTALGSYRSCPADKAPIPNLGDALKHFPRRYQIKAARLVVGTEIATLDFSGL
jgi:hypothetical protein